MLEQVLKGCGEGLATPLVGCLSLAVSVSPCFLPVICVQAPSPIVRAPGSFPLHTEPEPSCGLSRVSPCGAGGVLWEALEVAALGSSSITTLHPELPPYKPESSVMDRSLSTGDLVWESGSTFSSRDLQPQGSGT